MNQKQSEKTSYKNISLYDEDNYSHVVPGLIYIETSVPGVGVYKSYLNSKTKGCSCSSVCEPGSCACLLASGIKSSLDTVPIYLKRTYPIFECHMDCCRCSDLCSNKLTQSGPRHGLSIKHFGEKGFGVITEIDVPYGSFLCEYAGEYIGEEEAKRRLGTLRSTDPNYILFLREHIGYDSTSEFEMTIIDPTTIGNIGRYINHSCDPNSRLIPVRSHNMTPIAALFAIREIKAGEEITYSYNDYGLDLETARVPREKVFQSVKRCLCVSPKCKKYLPLNLSF